MKYFLSAATITLGLVCWQTLVEARPTTSFSAADLQSAGLTVSSAADLQSAGLEIGLISAEDVDNPEYYGFQPGELQPGSWLLIHPIYGGPGGPIVLDHMLPPHEPVPLTTLETPIRIVPSLEAEGVTGYGIGISQPLD